MRCSPCALGFSRSNQYNYIQGLEEYHWEGGIKDFFKGGEIKEGGDYLKKGGINTLCELWCGVQGQTYVAWLQGSKILVGGL